MTEDEYKKLTINFIDSIEEIYSKNLPNYINTLDESHYCNAYTTALEYLRVKILSNKKDAMADLLISNKGSIEFMVDLLADKENIKQNCRCCKCCR